MLAAAQSNITLDETELFSVATILMLREYRSIKAQKGAEAALESATIV